jgi:hypothetical protein
MQHRQRSRHHQLDRYVSGEAYAFDFNTDPVMQDFPIHYPDFRRVPGRRGSQEGHFRVQEGYFVRRVEGWGKKKEVPCQVKYVPGTSYNRSYYHAHT